MDSQMGEFITPSAMEDGAAIAMAELLRQLEASNDLLRKVTEVGHDTYHHARTTWDKCHHVTCRLVQDHLGEGTHDGEDDMPQSPT